jgi:hypothetical protein
MLDKWTAYVEATISEGKLADWFLFIYYFFFNIRKICSGDLLGFGGWLH